MKNFFKYIFVFIVLIEISLISITIFIDFETEKGIPESFFLNLDNSWADTLLKNMTLDEKIGQLFVMELVEVQSDSKVLLDSLINQFSIGGIKFKQTEVLNQLIITNYLQSKSKYPLLIGSDGSIINRSDFNLPVGPIINSSKDKHFIDYYFEQFAEVLKLEGVNIDFSNSLEGIDSLGSGYGFIDNDSIQKIQSVQFRKKLHNEKVISCLNFNDDSFFLKDSILSDSLKNLRLLSGIDKFFAVQLSPELSNFITSSPKHHSISKFLNQNYGFKGIIYSSAIDSISANSLFLLHKSGVDAFVVKNQIDKAILTFKSLISKGTIKEAEISKKVKKSLMAKTWAGLGNQEFKSAENSMSKILANQRKLLSWKIYEGSLCLLKNQNNLLPFSNLRENRTHLLVIGNEKIPFLVEYINNYLDCGITQHIKGEIKESSFAGYSNIILVINNIDSQLINDPLFIQSIKNLKQQKRLIVVNFGNPEFLEKLSFANAVIYAFDNHPFSQMIAAQIIAGSIAPTGQITPLYYKSKGVVSYKKIDRFEYTIPEAAGFNSIDLAKVDALIKSAIEMHVTPGCQIFAAKDGKVFYNKSFGNHTYNSSKPVKNSDIFDIASISKVAATTLASMKLYEGGLIRLNDSIKYYIEDTVNCTIKNHQLKDFFLHQSGLPADMPILQYIKYRNKNIKRFDKYYSEKPDTSYSVKVADHYYLRKDYVDSIVHSLYNLVWDTTKVYKYSDVNFNIIYDIISRKIKGKYSNYLSDIFYNPLQLRTMGFLPLDRFDESRIVPTQEDKYWRKQLLLGYPHDESAALYGGISGNAGLFSNANDLAILFQMLMNGGTYGGKQLFKKETVELFTSPQEGSTRGLGFVRNGNGAYGHTGFTGCVVWANPVNRTIFVFLSNSIHPNVLNKKLRKMEIREKVYDLIMQAYEPGSGVLKIGK